MARGTPRYRLPSQLDALRGVMMMLGIVLHAAMFYTVMESDVDDGVRALSRRL